MVTDKNIGDVMSVLKRAVKALHVPWLDVLASGEKDPYKILVSCILSLRTQDKTTEEASARLFDLASSPHEMAALSEGKIEKAIYPVGFYRTKAKTIKTMSETIAGKHGGSVPDSIDELLKLKGVGRKTANLVITLGFNKYGICVDTHVHRIVNRWGYIKTRTPEETEFALREKLPKRYWRELNGLLVAFGQNICKPLSPFCSTCDLKRFCGRIHVARHR